MTFGPDEEVLQEQMSKLLVGMWGVHLYRSSSGIVHFAKILSCCKLFISTSTGTFHLASLVGTPTITLFGSTRFASPKRWRGIGDISKQRHYILKQDPKERTRVLEEIVKEIAAF